MIAAAAVVVAGSVALLARPWLFRLPVDPVALLVVLFTLLLVAGAAWRLPAAAAGGDDRDGGGDGGDGDGRDAGDGGDEGGVGRRMLSPWLVLAVGIGAFGVGRLLSGGVAPVEWALRAVALATLAAVAEEAFYRRLAYGVASTAGPVVAIGASALVFALVHVTIWGWGVLPLDLAAGLLLGWQRWASGGWSVPAATHVAANLLAVLP